MSDTSFVIKIQNCEKFVKDDAEGATCSFRQPHEVIRKLSDLLTNQITAQMTERLDATLRCFLKCVGREYSIHDLNYIVDVLGLLLIKDAEKEKHFEGPIKELLEIARSAPVLESALCEMQSAHLLIILEYYLSHLGLCITYTDNENHREGLVRALHDLLCLPSPAKHAVKMDHLLKALEHSVVPTILCQILEDAPPRVYSMLLGILYSCSVRSDPIGLHIIDKGCLDIIILRMSPDHPSNVLVNREDLVPLQQKYRKLVDFSCELLSELMSIYDRVKLNLDIHISSEAVYKLKKMIDRASNVNDFLFTKNIRNKLMSTLVNLQVLFLDKGILEAFNRFGFSREMIFTEPFPRRNEACPQLSGKVTDEDKMFARMLLLSQLYILRSPTSLSEEEKLHLARQCVPQMKNDRDFLKFSFMLGRHFIPHLKEEFLPANNGKKLLKILRKFVKKSYKGEILVEVLKTLAFVVNMKDNNILVFLRGNGVLPLLISLFDKILHEDALVIDKTALVHAILGMIGLVEDNVEAQDAHYKAMKDIFKNCVKTIHIENTFNLTVDKQILISAVVLLLKSILQNPNSREKFTEEGGVYGLMDLLQNDESKLNGVVLRVLIELSEHQSTITFLLTWREKATGRSLLSKLCQIWRQVECAERVVRNDQGIIGDIEKPLMGERQRDQMDQMAIDSSPCVLDVRFNVRTKIYALVKQMNHHETVGEILKDQYKIGAHLDAQDKVTLLLIENYLPLKLNELWDEVNHAFQTHGMVHHPTNEEIFKEISETNRKFTQNLQDRQIGILNYERILRCPSEQNLYKSMMKKKIPCPQF
ncbi:hypothetical protein M8J76_017284 [Diaphorina citri]|nr:hypothetical protein M8J75_016324 [Diaphorina citri]KAI5714450.1 hypothetical protein M8J76_017284 [Diaphorina citri]